MSVVLAYQTLNECWIAADCRVTYDDGSVADDLQKLFPFWEHTVIGFVGCVDTAAELLQSLRRDAPILPGEVYNWIPRKLRHTYERLRGDKKVAFIVATVFRDCSRSFERAPIMKRMTKVMFSDQRFSFPGCLGQIMDNGSAPLVVPDAARTDACVIESPHFKPREVQPLSIASIGSGKAVADDLQDFNEDLLLTVAAPTASMFRHTFEQFINKHHEKHIGGRLCVARVGRRGITFENVVTRFYGNDGKTKQELRVEFHGERIVLVNTLTGVTITLRYPWEKPGRGTFPLTSIFPN